MMPRDEDVDDGEGGMHAMVKMPPLFTIYKASRLKDGPRSCSGADRVSRSRQQDCLDNNAARCMSEKSCIVA